MYLICTRKCDLHIEHRLICVVSKEIIVLKRKHKELHSFRRYIKIVFNWFFGVMQGT